MEGYSNFLKSFRHAFRGFWYMFRRERNFRIEVIIGVIVLAAAFLLKMKDWEIAAIIFAIFSILILESINTLVERLVNIFKPRIHPYAKMLKDVTASIVLIGSLGAFLIGLVIFWSYVFG
ncbi:MAG: diacylglycerol kinase family protein [Candidatus Moranbacteria bacterium]|nr:diacylglycerol kinase family protein [Candidatus Moranbacteria bacterium]